MNVWTIGALLVALAVGIWFTATRDAGESELVTEPSPSNQELATEQTESARVEDADAVEVSESPETAESSVTTDSANAESDAGRDASPFATVDSSDSELLDQVSPDGDQTVANVTDSIASEAQGTDEAQQSVRSGEPVVVPESYPVTDAAKYFVPREQRRPGNLGGPPPLDFPGGPNDPARADGETFLPPTAPGQ